MTLRNLMADRPIRINRLSPGRVIVALGEIARDRGGVLDVRCKGQEVLSGAYVWSARVRYYRRGEWGWTVEGYSSPFGFTWSRPDVSDAVIRDVAEQALKLSGHLSYWSTGTPRVRPRNLWGTRA